MERGKSPSAGEAQDLAAGANRPPSQRARPASRRPISSTATERQSSAEEGKKKQGHQSPGRGSSPVDSKSLSQTQITHRASARQSSPTWATLGRQRGRSGSPTQSTGPGAAAAASSAQKLGHLSLQKGQRSENHTRGNPSCVDVDGKQFKPKPTDGRFPMPSLTTTPRVRDPNFKMGVGIESEFFLEDRQQKLPPAKAMEFAKGLVERLNISMPLTLPPIRDHTSSHTKLKNRALNEWALLLDSGVPPRKIGCALELVSPILVASPQLPWRDIVVDTWQHLAKECIIHGDNSTGTHIHVSVEGGYSLQELKEVAKSAIHFESALDELLPKERTRSRSDSAKALGTKDKKENLGPTELASLFEKVDQSRTYHDFLRQIQLGPLQRYFSFNFASGIQKYYTIEFRKPPYCPTVEMVLAWAEFAVSFIRSSIRFGFTPEPGQNPPSLSDLAIFLSKSDTLEINQPWRLKLLFPSRAPPWPFRSKPSSRPGAGVGAAFSSRKV